MKISILLRRAAILLCLLFVTVPVYAAGFGIFVNGSQVDAEWDGDLTTFDSEGRHIDYGFAIDSNLAADRLFNYRFELGRAEWNVTNFNDQGIDAEMEGVVMNHDFGFGGLITDNVRFWFGPELRFSLLDGELKNTIARDIDLFGYGLGAAIGLNVNFPGRLTLAAKGGFVQMRYLGRGPHKDGISWTSSDYDVDENLLYLGFTMFFRTKS
jgi:hypothetical protein